MRVDVSGSQQNGTNDNVEIESRELVMGLRWDPSEHSVSPAEPHASLDACCALFDREFRAMEVVHPGHVWNADGSVIHTGDSKTGAGIWDDEQLFVFLEAVPYMISALPFLVTSVTGRSFGEIPGASCHVSDRITEHDWIRLELTGLGPRTMHCVATLHRGPARWRICPSAQHWDVQNRSAVFKWLYG